MLSVVAAIIIVATIVAVVVVFGIYRPNTDSRIITPTKKCFLENETPEDHEQPNGPETPTAQPISPETPNADTISPETLTAQSLHARLLKQGAVQVMSKQ